MNQNLFFFSFLTVFTLLVSCTGKDDSYSRVKSVNQKSGESNQDSITPDTIPIIDEPYCIQRRGTILDKQLLLFQKQLKLAIQKQDTDLLLSILDSNVVTSHGGALIGIEDFSRNWSDGGLWEKLETIVGFGGGFESDTTYRYPYFTIYKNERGYEKYKDTYPDPYTEYYSTKDTTFLFEDTLRSKIVAKLVGCFLYMDYSNGINYRSNWLQLTTYKDSIVGFVPKTDVYRTGDYNLIIEKDTLGNWRVTSFAPFD